jgi:hypothetical protein
MTYQPWTFEPTRELHDPCKKRFFNVWESEYVIIAWYQDKTLLKELLATNEDWMKKGMSGSSNDTITVNALPALTLSAFCEFVDEIQDKFIIPDSQKILMNIWLKSEIQEIIAKQLKHFAVDHWDEPEKIINEVKKYI